MDRALRDRAIIVADKAAEAYSRNRYRSWPACAGYLLERGYTERQTIAILRSKWMRWAAGEKNKASTKELGAYLDNPKNECTIEAVNELVRQTPGLGR